MNFDIAAWFYCIPELLGLIAAEPLTLCVAAAAAVLAAFALLDMFIYNRG